MTEIQTQVLTVASPALYLWTIPLFYNQLREASNPIVYFKVVGAGNYVRRA